MTQDEIIEMATEVYGSVHADDFKFAKLVAAKEREACAKVCEDERNDPDDQFKSYEDTHDDGWINGCNSCIFAIRTRGEA